MNVGGLSSWSVSDKPNRWDIVGAASSLALSAVFLSTVEAVLAVWLIVGFIASAVLIGPVAASALGQRVSSWLEAIGGSGRLLAVAITFVVWHYVVEPTLGIPDVLVTNFVSGGLLALGVVVMTETLRTHIFAAASS
jgi:hypothetical protein